MISMRDIGYRCRLFRLSKLGISQREIAEKIGCTAANISGFERGLNNNAIILYHYVLYGFDFAVAKGLYDNEMLDDILNSNYDYRYLRGLKGGDKNDDTRDNQNSPV